MDNIAGMIDHTLLIPDAPLGRYTEICRESTENSFYSVCVNSVFVPLVSSLLNHPGNSVKVTSVIGFSLGSNSLEVKLAEVNYALKNGAHELDFVIPIYAVKSKDWHHVKKEFEAIRKESEGHIIKAIFEVGALTDDEIKHCCDLAIATNLDFVKTSTGFFKELKPVETARYVKLMKNSVNGSRVKVKASGWIRTLADVELMIDSGASRIGCSKSVDIIRELNGR